MSIGKNKKVSILTLALFALFAIALSLFAVTPAHADFDATTGFTYVENGAEAYALIENSEFEDKEELLLSLQAISGLSIEYAEAIDPAVINLDEVEFSGPSIVGAFLAYDAVMCAIEEYNEAQTYGSSYEVSLPEVFVYGNTEVETDITAKTAIAAHDLLVSNSTGWENATKAEYAIAYYIYDEQGEELFFVNVDENKAPVIFPLGEDVVVVENRVEKGLVLDMVFTVDGVEYYILVSVAKQSSTNPEDLSQTVTYSASVFKVCDAEGNELYNSKVGSGQSPFSVEMLDDSEGERLTVKEYVANAKTVLMQTERKELYDVAVEFLYNLHYKISDIKLVETYKFAGKIQGLDRDYYSQEAVEEISALFMGAIEGAENAESYELLVKVLDEAYEDISAVLTIDEEAYEEFGAILVENKNYIRNSEANCEYNVALAFLEFYEGCNDKVKAVLQDEQASVLANVTRTGEYEINKLAESIDIATLSVNQVREIAKQLQETLTSVKNAGEDFDAINQAVSDFDAFIQNVSSSYSIVTALESGKVKVEGKIDSRAQLTATTGAVTDDTDVTDIDESKKQSSSTRRLSALEVFDITLSVNNNAINYIDDNGYIVTVTIDTATLEIFKIRGVDPASVLVAYVDANGKLETYETTLTFTYDDGTTATYTGYDSVEWDKIAEGSIMFVTQHFSSYYLMGNTSNLAFVRLSNLLTGLAESDALTYVLIGLGALVGVILLFILISFICSIGTRYKIKFVTNGGKKVKSIRRKYGKKLPELKTPVREGYVFTGWCIDPTLRYEFNRKVMPRANIKLYARWMSEEEYNAYNTFVDEAEDKTALIVEYYDKLRAKLAGCKKPVLEGEKSFVEQDMLAKLYADEDRVKLFVKTSLNYINEKNGEAYVVADEDKFEEFTVMDDESFATAVAGIEKMAEVNGLTVGEEATLEPSTYEDAVLGYAYIINYQMVADYNERYNALRKFALNFALTDEAKAENGKVVFELVPAGEVINVAVALDAGKYGKVLTAGKVEGATLENAFAVTTGEDMGVAFELLSLVLDDNGYSVAEVEFEDVTFEPEFYQFVTVLETAKDEVAEVVEEVVEEPTLEEMFKQYRTYVCSFAMYADEDVEVDRTNDGLIILKAKLCEDEIRTTVDPENDAEAFAFANLEEFEAAKEKVNALMEKYGLEYSDEAVELEEGEVTMFSYRLKFPVQMTAVELLGEIRKYTNSYAMFVEEDAEVDNALDGTVVVKACIKDGAVAVTVDPDAEATELTVSKEKELGMVYEAIAGAMEKYGLEVDPDYVPGEQVEGDNFGFRIKF